MTDREKVIKGLECCAMQNVIDLPDCEHCPYKDDSGTCTTQTQLFQDAIELLKAQEPRVLTLEEVKEMKRLTICAVEQRSKVIKNTFNVEYGGIVTLGNKNFLDFVLYGDTNRYRRTEAGYGKTWRCWTARPEEKVRIETPWRTQ